MPHPPPAQALAGPASPPAAATSASTTAPTGPSAARRATQGDRARGVPARQSPGVAASTTCSSDTALNTSGLTASPIVTWGPCSRLDQVPQAAPDHVRHPPPSPEVEVWTNGSGVAGA